MASVYCQDGDCDRKSRAITLKMVDPEQTHSATLKMASVYQKLHHATLKMAVMARSTYRYTQDGGKGMQVKLSFQRWQATNAVWERMQNCIAVRPLPSERCFPACLSMTLTLTSCLQCSLTMLLPRMGTMVVEQWRWRRAEVRVRVRVGVGLGLGVRS